MGAGSIVEAGSVNKRAFHVFPTRPSGQRFAHPLVPGDNLSVLQGHLALCTFLPDPRKSHIDDVDTPCFPDLLCWPEVTRVCPPSLGLRGAQPLCPYGSGPRKGCRRGAGVDVWPLVLGFGVGQAGQSLWPRAAVNAICGGRRPWSHPRTCWGWGSQARETGQRRARIGGPSQVVRSTVLDKTVGRVPCRWLLAPDMPQLFMGMFTFFFKNRYF